MAKNLSVIFQKKSVDLFDLSTAPYVRVTCALLEWPRAHDFKTASAASSNDVNSAPLGARDSDLHSDYLAGTAVAAMAQGAGDALPLPTVTRSDTRNYVRHFVGERQFHLGRIGMDPLVDFNPLVLNLAIHDAPLGIAERASESIVDHDAHVMEFERD